MRRSCGGSTGHRVAILLLCILAALGASATDLQVLQNFAKGVTNSATLNWVGNDPCSWTQIQCSSGNVVGLRLRKAGLSGTVTPDINQLTHLTELELNFNSFTGQMPSLAGMANLQLAYLDDNNFTTIPYDFFQGLTSLQALNLDHNSGLNGTGGWTIPSDLQKSTVLANLSVTDTNLNSIPTFLGGMPRLKVFSAAYNKINGTIPGSFSGSNIEILQLNNQGLSGTISPVGGMLALKQLWLQVNQLTGPIPDGLVNASGLQDVRLNNNFLVGQIPLGLASSTLTNISLQGNNLFTGELPPFSQAVTVSSDNTFCAAAGKACSSDITSLIEFLKAAGYPETLSQAWIGTSPCTWSGLTCSNGTIVSMALSSSGLVGTISPFLGNLTALKSILLNGNNLTGPIPNELLNLKQLSTLDVSNNNLSGAIPQFPTTVALKRSGNAFLGVTVPPTTPPPVPGTPNNPPATPGTPTPATPGAPTPATPGAPTPATPPLSNGTGAGTSGKASSVSVGAIVGGIVGGLALLAIAGFVVFCVCKRRQKKFLRVQSPNTVLVHPRDSGPNPEVVKIVVNQNGTQTTEGTARSQSGPSEVQVDLALDSKLNLVVLSKYFYAILCPSCSLCFMSTSNQYGDFCKNQHVLGTLCPLINCQS